MNKIMKDLPMLIFVTCQQCPHCIEYRGIDGKPSDDKEWNSSNIRKLLMGDNGQLKCSRLINIHDSQSGPYLKNISEFIIYCMVSTDVQPNFFNLLMADEPLIVGNSILRVAILRGQENQMKIEVELDGEKYGHKCDKIREQVEDFFMWNQIPREFEQLKDFFEKHNLKYEDIVTPELKQDSFYSILQEHFSKFSNNPLEYTAAIKKRFNYDWFLDTFFPVKLRDLEIFYPSWLLILPKEWGRGLSCNGSEIVYAKVRGCNTVLVGNKYKSTRVNNEKIEDVITQYYSGKIALTYSEKLLN